MPDITDALFEKCIIYDGGARRYEIPLHFQEVFEYWKGLLERADLVDPLALTCEKLGYDGPIEYEEWLKVTGLESIPHDGLPQLWKDEQELIKRAPEISIRELAARRIMEISKVSKYYE